MVVAHLTYDGLVKILKEHHWEIASNDYWNDYDRIIFEKDGENPQNPFENRVSEITFVM